LQAWHGKYDLICKPVDSSMGRGVFKISCEDALQDSKLYPKLVNKNYLCEQCLVSIAPLAEFHPNSLNTVRVVTLRKNGEILIPWAFLRTGNNNSVIDNGHVGGVCSMIDVQSGQLYTDGVNIHNIYEAHPFSGKTFKGFQIPHWDKVLNAAKEAANIYPDAVIAGWDFAICNDDTIELIEGNSKPDCGAEQKSTNCGARKVFQEFLR